MGIEAAVIGPALEGVAGGTASGIMDLVSSIGGSGMQLIGGYLQGQSAEKQAKKDRKLQMYLQRQQLYSQGAFAPTVPLMKDSLGRLISAYDQTGQFINPYAGGNEAFTQAYQLAMDPNVYNATQSAITGSQTALGNALSGYQNFMESGGITLTPEQVAAGAGSLLNTDLINAQVDAYSRDIARNLGETTSNIRAADVASGNLGSSRGGVQEAIARRGAEDRIADFRGNLTGQALQQSQNILQGNIDRTGSGYSNLADLAGAQLQGAGAGMGVMSSYLGNLGTVGTMQQNLMQADINNLIAQRDYGVTREAQLGSLLRDYASVGNLPKGMV